MQSGGQTTPGHGGDLAILLLLAAGFLAIAAGLWLEYVWAWWAGVSAAIVVIVVGSVLNAPDSGWMIWSVFLVAFGISGVQGWVDESRARRERGKRP